MARLEITSGRPYQEPFTYWVKEGRGSKKPPPIPAPLPAATITHTLGDSMASIHIPLSEDDVQRLLAALHDAAAGFADSKK